MRMFLAACAAFGSVALVASPAFSEWPEREISLMVPFSPGGGVDQLMLPLQPLLSEELGVSILMDYQPGGGTQRGYQLLEAQGNDGYMIGAWVLPHVIGTILYQDPTYSFDDFAPVGIVSGDVPIWFTHTDSPYEDMNDLVTAARERPGEITIAIGSFTGEHYLTVVQLEQQEDIQFRTVNVGGGADVMSNVVGGHFDVGVSRPSSILGVQDEIKGLGVVAQDRSSLFPETMTFAEQFGGEIDVSNLRFAVGVTTTRAFAEENPEGFERLVEAVRTAVHSDEYRDALERAGRELTYMSPSEAEALGQEMYAVMEEFQPLVEAAQEAN